MHKSLIILTLLLTPLLTAMQCNKPPVPHQSDQCVRAMQEFARESKERGLQMKAVASILGQTSLRDKEQTEVLKKLTEEIRNWRCVAITPNGTEVLPLTPVPIPTPQGLPGG